MMHMQIGRHKNHINGVLHWSPGPIRDRVSYLAIVPEGKIIGTQTQNQDYGTCTHVCK